MRAAWEQAALLHMRDTEPKNVVVWAAHMAAEGSDSEPLIQLAGLSRSEYDQVEPVLRSLLEDLGVAEPSDRDATMFVATLIARQIITKAVSPHDGARAIWMLAEDHPTAERSLRAFKAYAAGWEDEPQYRDDYEQDIQEAAASIAVWAFNGTDPT